MNTRDSYKKVPKKNLRTLIKHIFCNHKWQYESVSYCGHKIPGKYSGATWIKTCIKCGKEVYK